MLKNVNLMISQVPNDLYLFQPWLSSKIKAPSVNPIITDLTACNQAALKAMPDVCKVSTAIFPQICHQYEILPVGAAIVTHSGPKLVAREHYSKEHLSKKTLAVPGKETTAYILSRLLLPRFLDELVCPYDQVIQHVTKQQTDCGLLIHESSFLIKQAGLVLLEDLGERWQEKTNLPLPLGVLVLKKSLGQSVMHDVTRVLKRSVAYADLHKDYVISKIQGILKTTDQHWVRKSVFAWVNDETRCLSKTGRLAIETLCGYCN